MSIYVLEAEQNIIGSALYKADDCTDAFDRLRPEHFFEPAHVALWGLILDCQRKGKLAEPIMAAEALSAHPGFVELGGLAYLADLVDHAQTWAIEPHVEAVLDRSARRAIHALTKEIQGRATNTAEATAEAVLADLERGAAEIARESVTRPSAVPAGLTALENMEAAWRGEFVGTPTGLQCLDHVSGGIRQDDVWFIGGRTSMGKSAVSLGLGRGIAEQGRGVMIFSLEMPLREVQARLVSDIAHDPRHNEQVRYGDILKGRFTAPLQDRARIAARQLASLPIMVTDVGGLTIEDIRVQAQRQIRAWEKAGVKPGAVIIDHIGLVKPVRRTDNKVADTADTVNELKGMAKQLRCPIIALVQVNRQTEGRNDKRPEMSDLNWSGAIEQIADFICLLYREAYYLERAPGRDAELQAAAVANEIELLVRKNRAGPICTLKAWIDVAANAIRDPDTVRQLWRAG